MPLYFPSQESSAYPIIGTLTLFQVTFQQYIFINSRYLDKELHNIDSDKAIIEAQTFDTLNLANSIYIIGAFIGNEIAKKLLKSTPSRLIFIIADIICIISSCSTFILFVSINAFFVLRIALGISAGINFSFSIIYMSQMTNKLNYQFLSKFIPFQLQFGYFLGVMLTHSQNDSLNYFIMISTLPAIVNLVRIFLFSLLFTYETPQCYAFIYKEDQKSQMMLDQIHSSQKSSYTSLEQLKQSNTLITDFTSTQLFSTRYVTKFIKCQFLIIILQLSGIYIFMNQYMLFTYESSNTTNNNNEDLLILVTLIGLLIILIQFIISQLIPIRILLYLGQSILIIGLALQSYVNQFDYAFLLCAIGYQIGIGTLIFQFVPLQIPDLGVFSCCKMFWMIQIGNIWLLGLISNRDFLQRETGDRRLIMIRTSQIYLYCSIIGLLLMIFILAVLIYVFIGRNQRTKKNYRWKKLSLAIQVNLSILKQLKGYCTVQVRNNLMNNHLLLRKSIFNQNDQLKIYIFYQMDQENFNTINFKKRLNDEHHFYELTLPEAQFKDRKSLYKRLMEKYQQIQDKLIYKIPYNALIHVAKVEIREEWDGLYGQYYFEGLENEKIIIQEQQINTKPLEINKKLLIIMINAFHQFANYGFLLDPIQSSIVQYEENDKKSYMVYLPTMYKFLDQYKFEDDFMQNTISFRTNQYQELTSKLFYQLAQAIKLEDQDDLLKKLGKQNNFKETGVDSLQADSIVIKKTIKNSWKQSLMLYQMSNPEFVKKINDFRSQIENQHKAFYGFLESFQNKSISYQCLDVLSFYGQNWDKSKKFDVLEDSFSKFSKPNWQPYKGVAKYEVTFMQNQISEDKYQQQNTITYQTLINSDNIIFTQLSQSAKPIPDQYQKWLSVVYKVELLESKKCYIIKLVVPEVVFYIDTADELMCLINTILKEEGQINLYIDDQRRLTLYASVAQGGACDLLPELIKLMDIQLIYFYIILEFFKENIAQGRAGKEYRFQSLAKELLHYAKDYEIEFETVKKWWRKDSINIWF